jgi:O-antigen/teichoic acid export membrane protein
LVITLLSTNVIVGLYTFANALARATADAAGSGLVNVLRSRLASDERVDERGLVERFMGLAALGGAASATVIIFLTPLLAALFDAAWVPAIRIVPILAVAVVPAVISWCASALLIHEGMARALLGPQLVGLALGAAAGVVLSFDLTAGALVVVLREIVGLVLRLRALPFALGKTARVRLAWTTVAVIVLGMIGHLYLRNTT